KGFAGASGSSGTSTPARAAPTASASGPARAVATGNVVTALKPATAQLREEATAFKRDYEQRARELTEEAPADTLFSDTAAKEAAEAKALAAERRQKALMQGYTGNMCSECGNFTMVRNGTCEKCDTCGATSGCS